MACCWERVFLDGQAICFFRKHAQRPRSEHHAERVGKLRDFCDSMNVLLHLYVCFVPCLLVLVFLLLGSFQGFLDASHSFCSLVYLGAQLIQLIWLFEVGLFHAAGCCCGMPGAL